MQTYDRTNEMLRDRINMNLAFGGVKKKKVVSKKKKRVPCKRKFENCQKGSMRTCRFRNGALALTQKQYTRIKNNKDKRLHNDLVNYMQQFPATNIAYSAKAHPAYVKNNGQFQIGTSAFEELNKNIKHKKDLMRIMPPPLNKYYDEDELLPYDEEEDYEKEIIEGQGYFNDYLGGRVANCPKGKKRGCVKNPKKKKKVTKKKVKGGCNGCPMCGGSGMADFDDDGYDDVYEDDFNAIGGAARCPKGQKRGCVKNTKKKGKIPSQLKPYHDFMKAYKKKYPNKTRDQGTEAWHKSNK